MSDVRQTSAQRTDVEKFTASVRTLRELEPLYESGKPSASSSETLPGLGDPQYSSDPTTSPPARVASLSSVVGESESFRKRTEPSANRALNPPGWGLPRPLIGAFGVSTR